MQPMMKRPRVDRTTCAGPSFERWARAAPPLQLPQQVKVMQVDIDYYTALPDPRFVKPERCSAPSAGKEKKAAVLRMYSLTEQGNSILVHIHGFEPYFYVKCPQEERQRNPALLRESLERQLRADNNNRDKDLEQMVHSVEIVMCSNLYGWQGSTEHTHFFKVTVALPSLVAKSRNLIENGLELTPGDYLGRNRDERTTFETNVPFALRFMVDTGLVGGGWCSLTGFERRGPNGCGSSCQMEFDVAWENVQPVDMIQIAPLRIMSFDIECWNPEGKGFPKAEQSPVIQIAVYMKEHGRQEKLMHAVWCLNTCNDIAGAEVFAFEEEVDLLLSFGKFIEAVDPDIITGYNIMNFDLPYLIDRADVLQVKWDFCKLGRTSERTRKRINEVQGREVIEVNIDGRVVFDMLVVMQKEQKLSSYSLNAVSAEFLGEQKEDVHYSMIGDLFKTSSETRRRLAVYCLKDAYLPMQLIDKLLCMYNYVEMARVTGTPINFLLTRGQMIKVVSQLLRKARQLQFVMPTLRSEKKDDKYEGATVLEPLCAYYDKPIATLDFASLYPSIMMAHNLCYTTLIDPERASTVPQDSVTRTPSGHLFVKRSTRQGLLPVILEELLAARKRAKKAMAEAEDPLTKSVLNGRQLALKVSANSVYGFTGATVGVLPCLEISSSVTSFGRTMIEHTKSMVEKEFRIEKGYKHDAQVIYGDTDSVMVKFGVDTVAEAMDLGLKAADMVSDTFLKPIKLEFEKVYFPYLLMNKKRYAGLYWTNPDKWDKMDAKGIETVRRDNCALVRQTVQTVLNTILINRSIDGAIKYVQDMISDLLQNKIDLSLLIITKSLGKGDSAEDYAARQAHVELAMRMKKRDPSTAPGSGDRVPYVVISGPKGAKTYEKSEDPLYALDNNLCIDAQYYIENQLKQPLLRIFGPAMGGNDGDKKAEGRLFKGAHTMTVKANTPQNTALGMFVKKSVRCMGCKALITDPKLGSMCNHCSEGKAGEVIIDRIQELREKEEEYGRLWTQCQRCQGSLMETVICSNSDCEIFYRRARARKDVQILQERMSKLNIDMSW